MCSVKRYKSDTKAYMNIPCPAIVKISNKVMGGVDLADMLTLFVFWGRFRAQIYHFIFTKNQVKMQGKQNKYLNTILVFNLSRSWPLLMFFASLFTTSQRNRTLSPWTPPGAPLCLPNSRYISIVPVPAMYSCRKKSALRKHEASTTLQQIRPNPKRNRAPLPSFRPVREAARTHKALHRARTPTTWARDMPSQ